MSFMHTSGSASWDLCAPSQLPRLSNATNERANRTANGTTNEQLASEYDRTTASGSQLRTLLYCRFISSVRNRTIFHMDRVGGILSLLIVTVVGKRLCFYRLFVSEPGSWEWGMQKGFRVGIWVCRMVDVGCA
ncbi:uncharacterized protein LOC120284735 [Drosophila simulans]|uniref:uncharacterized protein LOC120284735 n=1 Tax=Drosophila simulans TaxID=7240 RepID=UPI001D109FC2|nr:uncharacterized protein LOC120284735 [Drosophila simulans]